MDGLCADIRWLTNSQVEETGAAAASVISVGAHGHHLWEWFWQLERARRQRNGLEPLSHAEVLAWATLYGESPLRWEIDALFRMDATRRETYAEAKRPSVETPENKDPQLRTMVPFNPSGVKAMFGALARARGTKVV